jgi:UDP-2-acetamido-2,6-beta-L-arabino-hexul-4-ose reductase
MMDLLTVHSDERGRLFEIKQNIQMCGTQFISYSRPDVIRGNHYHQHKTEYFTVLQGEAVLRLRDKFNGNEANYWLHDNYPRTIRVAPYWVHAIQNTGPDELILLVQSDQVFDPEQPDTYSEEV